MKKKKRLNQRQGLKLVRLLGIIIFLGIVIIPLNLFNISSAKEEIKIKEDNNEIKEVILEEEKYEISLVMVGDALIHDDIYLDAKEGDNYNFCKMLEPIKEIVSKHDLAYYNQETILGGTEIGLSSYPAFNSPYEVGNAFLDAGFNLVSLATNHTLDRGEKAVHNSRNYWNSKATNSTDSVLAVGSYSSNEERDKVEIRSSNNITYTMLNYTYGTNGIKVPTGKEYLVNVWSVTGSNPETDTSYQNYKEIVRNDINRVRDKVDLLMVAMHWGVEYQISPNSYQKDMANFLAELGVDIIIGTHPHVIQPIEWIDDTLVIYSLGNFISAHEVVNMDNRVGLMSSIDIIKTIKEDEVNIELSNLENELLYTYYTSDYKDFKVIPFSNLNEEYLRDYRNIYSRYKNIIQNIDSNINVSPID